MQAGGGGPHLPHARRSGAGWRAPVPPPHNAPRISQAGPAPREQAWDAPGSHAGCAQLFSRLPGPRTLRTPAAPPPKAGGDRERGQLGRAGALGIPSRHGRTSLGGPPRSYGKQADMGSRQLGRAGAPGRKQAGALARPGAPSGAGAASGAGCGGLAAPPRDLGSRPRRAAMGSRPGPAARANARPTAGAAPHKASPAHSPPDALPNAGAWGPREQALAWGPREQALARPNPGHNIDRRGRPGGRRLP